MVMCDAEGHLCAVTTLSYETLLKLENEPQVAGRMAVNAHGGTRGVKLFRRLSPAADNNTLCNTTAKTTTNF
ncbi:hypothetical protein KIN20_005126 [Parelaphostrongylus tenuis]|uniref:Uncharacterized protein n=1 Tax=Parelaphostrongylus tenuis TaxID=148309 RepID=A0AAD5MID8_PARTN|nr:hypothetical protein KIN20_005126 [Parelaphostrongylus tenuis]